MEKRFNNIELIMILSKEQVVPLMDYIDAVTRHFGPDIQYDILYQVLITMVP